MQYGHASNWKETRRDLLSLTPRPTRLSRLRRVDELGGWTFCVGRVQVCQARQRQVAADTRMRLCIFQRSGRPCSPANLLSEAWNRRRGCRPLAVSVPDQHLQNMPTLGWDSAAHSCHCSGRLGGPVCHIAWRHTERHVDQSQVFEHLCVFTLQRLCSWLRRYVTTAAAASNRECISLEPRVWRLASAP